MRILKYFLEFFTICLLAFGMLAFELGIVQWADSDNVKEIAYSFQIRIIGCLEMTVGLLMWILAAFCFIITQKCLSAKAN